MQHLNSECTRFLLMCPRTASHVMSSGVKGASWCLTRPCQVQTTPWGQQCTTYNSNRKTKGSWTLRQSATCTRWICPTSRSQRCCTRITAGHRWGPPSFLFRKRATLAVSFAVVGRCKRGRIRASTVARGSAWRGRSCVAVATRVTWAT